jgi:DNA polymerase III delta prime subunit
MQSHLTGNVFLIRGASLDGVLAYLEQEGTAVSGNPDVYIRIYGQFGIDDAHDLTARAVGRATGARGRTFVISASGMTTEAQNALLKTIEDPPGDARFFFIIPSPETLLSTVRSRAQMHSFDDTDQADGEAARNAAAFLAALPAQRLDLLKPLLEKGDDDKRDVGAMIAFLSSLEIALSSFPHQRSRDGLHAIYHARKYMGDKGALVKPLLESVALLCPQVAR